MLPQLMISNHPMAAYVKKTYPQFNGTLKVSSIFLPNNTHNDALITTFVLIICNVNVPATKSSSPPRWLSPPEPPPPPRPHTTYTFDTSVEYVMNATRTAYALLNYTLHC